CAARSSWSRPPSSPLRWTVRPRHGPAGSGHGGASSPTLRRRRWRSRRADRAVLIPEEGDPLATRRPFGTARTVLARRRREPWAYDNCGHTALATAAAGGQGPSSCRRAPAPALRPGNGP